MKCWLITEIGFSSFWPSTVVATEKEAYQYWLDHGGRELRCKVYLIDVEACTVEDVRFECE